MYSNTPKEMKKIAVRCRWLTFHAPFEIASGSLFQFEMKLKAFDVVLSMPYKMVARDLRFLTYFMNFQREKKQTCIYPSSNEGHKNSAGGIFCSAGQEQKAFNQFQAVEEGMSGCQAKLFLLFAKFSYIFERIHRRQIQLSFCWFLRIYRQQG